jgi:hypothetical protein
VTTRAAAIILFLLVLSAPLGAQRAWEVSGGYSYLHDPPDATDFPAGWLAGTAITVGPWPWFAVVADVSGHVTSSFDIDLSTFALLGGARASARIGPFTEFAQLAAGVVRAKSTVVGITSAEENAAVQPGGGVDIPLAARLAARLQFDYRLVFGGIDAPIADPRHQFRYSLSLVYRHR